MFFLKPLKIKAEQNAQPISHLKSLTITPTTVRSNHHQRQTLGEKKGQGNINIVLLLRGKVLQT